MSNHTVVYRQVDGTWWAKCSCREKSGVGDQGFVEAWAYAHHKQIEKIRTHLGSRNISLRTQREWFLTQADNAENPAEDRVLWRQLADELERYVTRTQPTLQQDALF